MAAVHIETSIRAPAPQVWQALAATGDAHLAFAGVLTDCRLEREDVRVATFANGQVVKERIVSVEPQRRVHIECWRAAHQRLYWRAIDHV